MNNYYDFLRTATPYVREHQGRLFLVKLGGELLADEQTAANILEQLALLLHLGINIAIVHGGAPQIAGLCERLGIDVDMQAGRRVTSPAVMEAVSMTLCGSMQARITASLTALGVRSVGICGADAGMLIAGHRPPVVNGDGTTTDYGEVGDIQIVDTRLIDLLCADGCLPVIAPLASDGQGRLLNINADTVAAQLAVAAGAAKLIFLMGPAGILADPQDPGSLIAELDPHGLLELERSGVISNGMLPKSAAAQAAIAGGVERVHFVSGLTRDALLREIFTNEGSGTMVVSHA